MEGNLSERYIRAKRALFDKAYDYLNEKQRQAVFRTEGPLLILAGAGSGKTTVLVQRIAYIIRYGNAYASQRIPYELSEAAVEDLEHAVHLSREEILPILDEFIEKPCEPWRMLAITFTNKAAGEIKSRLVKRFGDESIAKDIWSGTFHSICVRILRQWGERVGYDRNFTIYDTDDTKKMITAIIKRLNINDKQFPVKSVMNAISRAKDAARDAEAFANEAGADYRLSRIARIYAAYEEELHRSNAMDFDDIILHTVRLLREQEDVRTYYQRKFRYVCVDEYQDTNLAQFELAALLSGGTGNLMVVGDDDQSIYKFRGATIDNILGFDRVYRHASVIKLEQNYRSTKTILDAANRVIAHNQGRKGKELWTSGEQGEKITLYKCEDQLAESRVIVDTVHRMMADGDGRSYRDFAVLYRTNTQSSSVERAFAKSAIPYRMLGGTRFNDRKEIRDAVAYLHLIVNHADRERLLRIINVPGRKIGAKTLEVVEAIAQEQGCSLFEVIDRAGSYAALGRSVNALQNFADLIRELGRIAEQATLSELFDAVMERTGYMRMLEEAGEEEKERIDNLFELKSNMLEYSRVCEENGEEPTLVGFLEENALVADVDKYDEKADAVVLMTVHSAKGLEFPVVFLPGMEDGIFPGMQNIVGNPEDMEEERRLAYVAITRAKEKVVILHAKSRLWYGQTTYNPVSRFVSEIPEELVEKTDLTAAAGAWHKGGAMGMGGYGNTVTGGNQVRTYYAEGAELPRRNRAPAHTDRTTVGQTAKPMVNAAARATVNALAPGDRVSHVTFGEGSVLSVRPMGADKLIEVMFDTVGTKKLMGTYAKLKKL